MREIVGKLREEYLRLKKKKVDFSIYRKIRPKFFKKNKK